MVSLKSKVNNGSLTKAAHALRVRVLVCWPTRSVAPILRKSLDLRGLSKSAGILWVLSVAQ